MKLLVRMSALLTTVLVAALLAMVPTAPARAATSVFAVPTSNAGLGRITTAPNGDMWFIESAVGKVGRITPAGTITEFNLPPTTTGEVDGSVYGLDVAPDGTVWVTYDFGRKIVAIDPVAVSGKTYGLFGYPYGGEVRVAPDGRVFVTVNYDESGVATLAPGGAGFNWSANSPECEDVLGEAADGSMWCQGSGLDQLVHLNADATGGTPYPLPSDATYPNGIAAGPVGSIWFTRSSSGSWLTSPNNGSVGYLDQATGATAIWKTGSRTAPQDLIKAPDGTMWFTNAGAAPGIGHISATGVGAITSVGNYEPTSLTWGADGAIWFTDAKNNSIVRVTTDQLQTTNIDLGSGVTMTAPAGPAPVPTTPPATPGIPGTPPAPGTTGLPTGALVTSSGVVKVKKLKIPVKVSCPATATQGCIGSLRVSVGKKSITKKSSYLIGSGTTVVVKAKVTAKGKKALRVGRKTTVTASLTAVGATKAGAKRKLKVVRS